MAQAKMLANTVSQYLEFEMVEEHRKHIESLAGDASKSAELARLLGQRLLFGTAGIRGPMGPGYAQMNELVVIQTSQGLASYLLEQFGQQQCASRGVLIGHDARRNSARFARLVACAMLHRRIRVRFSEKIVPTPVVAYGVRCFSCLAGVVVTASHNPKQDNGYKVYWHNGAQILAPHDKNIQQHIEANLRPWPDAWLGAQSDCAQLTAKFGQLFACAHDQIVDAYFDYVRRDILKRQPDDDSNEAENTELGITYSAMHGVGHEFVTRALKLAGFRQLYAVDEQREPDADFPTLAFPNPEERGALELAFRRAAATGSALVLAVDPDADRCAAAELDRRTGQRRTLTGNEIGALLGWWLWHKLTSAPAAAADERPPARCCYMLSTAVSSRFLSSMARVEGFNFVETLTGFKYMGNEAERIMRASERATVVFAYEEAIGYMVNSKLLDKDGISAALELARCAEYLRSAQGGRRSLSEHLAHLYNKYGYHYSLNSYYHCNERAKIELIFKRLQQCTPRDFCDGQFRVARVRDLNSGFDSAQADFRATLPTSSSSFMVTFFATSAADNDGAEISFTIRTSGTEPKIKYYSEIVAKLAAGDDGLDAERAAAARDKLRRFVRAAVERCLTPRELNLVPAVGDSAD